MDVLWDAPVGAARHAAIPALARAAVDAAWVVRAVVKTTVDLAARVVAAPVVDAVAAGLGKIWNILNLLEQT